jgi:hypothetical protein
MLAEDHDLVAERGDADRGLPVEAAVPIEPIRLVAWRQQNSLGVILDRREQVVGAAAGEGGKAAASAISSIVVLNPMAIYPDPAGRRDFRS